LGGRWHFRNWSLKGKSLFFFAVLILLPSTVFSSFVLYQVNQILKREAVESTERHLDAAEKNLSAKIQDIEDISSYMIFSEDFRNYMALERAPENAQVFEDLEERLKGFLTFHLAGKNYINSVTVEGINGNKLHFGEPVRAAEKQWIRLAKERKGKIVWSSAYAVSSGWSGKKYVVTLFRVINDINDAKRPIGLVRIRINARDLYQSFTGAVTRDKGRVFVVQRDGSVVLDDDDKYLGNIYPDSVLVERILRFPDNETFFHFRYDKGGLAVLREIGGPGWYLVSIVDEGKIVRDLKSVYLLTWTMFLSSVLLGILALTGFYNFIVLPVVELTKQTRRVEKGDFSAQVPVRSDDEIGKLAARFNRMVATIQRLIDLKYKVELKQRESELKALQNQIDPHFLYNTLDMIRWSALLEKATETSRLIETLSRLFRLTLNRGKLWVPLREELAYVESYLKLQQKRLGNGFRFEIRAGKELQEAIVLKQILQPVVENCIVHGFRGLDRPGLIEIACSLENGRLHINVSDNGSGVDAAAMNARLHGGDGEQDGHALKNVNDRIKLLFGSQCGVWFVERREGACARFILPFISREDEIIKITNSFGERRWN
jgi:two-component system sensor histidine kinase YesM